MKNYHTERELLLSYQAQHHYFSTRMNHFELTGPNIGELLPASMIVQDVGLNYNLFMNKVGCDYLGKDSDALREMGPEYFLRFFPLEEMLNLKRNLVAFGQQNDFSLSHSFFQRVRADFNADYNWYLTSSRLTPETISSAATLIHVSVPLSGIDGLSLAMRNVLGMEAQYAKDFQKFSSLTRREKELIVLMVNGKSSLEIAYLLHRSIHTINSHRKNIFKKLSFSSLAQLTRFAICYHLVEF
ncbi:hypothetical protein IM793_06225 [Pedobacter sp. MR2016-19]|uniref:helix-turn-helix domain-containing protein n=1 Tax=Pedobacter sp. MR2016-19 TaxID=2780089 RepID=UPI0018750032|nr:helix-turn-helix transcriptional regulator [Pedobacter sp. MR2016-19]MBE5318741.1 hypothetical protein [Pedobacter sp. MR2016-19]